MLELNMKREICKCCGICEYMSRKKDYCIKDSKPVTIFMVCDEFELTTVKKDTVYILKALKKLNTVVTYREMLNPCNRCKGDADYTVSCDASSHSRDYYTIFCPKCHWMKGKQHTNDMQAAVDEWNNVISPKGEFVPERGDGNDGYC